MSEKSKANMENQNKQRKQKGHTGQMKALNQASVQNNVMAKG